MEQWKEEIRKRKDENGKWGRYLTVEGKVEKKDYRKELLSLRQSDKAAKLKNLSKKEGEHLLGGNRTENNKLCGLTHNFATFKFTEP